MAPPRSPDCPNDRPGVEDDQKTGKNAPSAWARPSPDRYINGETHDIPVYLAGPRWPLQRSRVSTRFKVKVQAVKQ
jgi:hypothetical protein